MQLDQARFEKAFEAYSEAKNTLIGIEAAIRAYVGQGLCPACKKDLAPSPQQLEAQAEK